MRRGLRYGLSPARLRVVLAVLLLALALPSAVLIWQTQQQLRWESLHQYRTLAEEMATRIDLALQQLIVAEEARSESDYQFLVLAGDPDNPTRVRRSALAELPAASSVPGLIGYFQVAADGSFSTPLLPDDSQDAASLGLGAAELAQRLALRQQLLEVLASNQLLTGGRQDKLIGGSGGVTQERQDVAVPAGQNEAAKGASVGLDYQSQAAFDQLNSAPADTVRQQSNQLGRVDDLRLDRGYAESGKKDADLVAASEAVQMLTNASTRGKRKEQSAVLDALTPGDLAEAKAGGRVRIFESEIDPFEFGLLASGHGVLFRKVWHEGERTIQGVLIDQRAFIDGTIARSYNGSALAQMSDLVVAWQQEVLQLIPGQTAARSLSNASEVQGELLYQTRLSAPLDRLQLIYSVRRLPAGPGAVIVYWASALLYSVLLGGFWALYRLGLRQILLARQQQDFVSAVSHELKTPLTSIRMYAEMLRAGWASEDKKRSYYDYIFDESERLSRLIANVLQLARMERSDFVLDLKTLSVGELLDLVRSKVHTQIEQAGFVVDYRIDPACAQATLKVDPDAWCQIMINLVDNAIKYTQSALERRIEIAIAPGANGIVISVRDFGPGIARAQMQKIFQLFYRSGDELTRESLGTGIGLALVRQLARAMGGEVEVVNRQPGAEFQLRLPR